MADEPASSPTPTEPAAPPAATIENQKSYSLTDAETRMLVMVRDNQNAIFSVILSHIANSRLGYAVTGNTQFVLNNEMNKIDIGELKLHDGGDIQASAAPAPVAPTPPAPPAGAPEATPQPESAVKTSDGGQVAGGN